MSTVIVVGAGIVGVSIAIALQRRGRDVLLLDRRLPGEETSFGNAGIIQSEGIRPRAFPRSFGELWQAARGGGIDVRYDWQALPALARPFARYWWHSEPRRYEAIVKDYAPLILTARGEHERLIAEAGLDSLVRKQGWMLIFRTPAARDRAFGLARTHYPAYGVAFDTLDDKALAQKEPDLREPLAGALHWTDPWTIVDPGALVAGYARLFEQLGGRIARGTVSAISRHGAGWRAQTETGPHEAAEIVLAPGPWANSLLRPLGYRFPLFAKRGYHMHYGLLPGAALRNWLLDIEVGYLVSPMRQGVRLTTGAEFARLDSPATPAQLEACEAVARRLLPLAARRDDQPWLGSRPCTPDMKPIIGPAPRHPGLWLAFGHAHHGFTLGPVTGRVLAEAMTGERPLVPLAPFSPSRFVR